MGIAEQKKPAKREAKPFLHDEVEDPDVETVLRRNGGRSARVRDAVLQATLQALAEQGLEGLTFSEIGRRSGVHATSIQRRWGSLANLVFEAALLFANQTIAVPNTGSLRGDLVALIGSMRDYFYTPFGGAILQMLVTADQDRAHAANRAEFMRARFEAMHGMMRRAEERGELRKGVDIEIALELALGPLYVRTLIRRLPISDELVEHAIDILMRGLAK